MSAVKTAASSAALTQAPAPFISAGWPPPPKHNTIIKHNDVPTATCNMINARQDHEYDLFNNHENRPRLKSPQKRTRQI